MHKLVSRIPWPISMRFPLPWTIAWSAPCDQLLNEWDGMQMVAADRLTSVPGASLGRIGNVMRVEVRRGDLTHDGWRAEAIGPEEHLSPWSVRYSWWTSFPTGYPAEIKLVYGPNAGKPAFQVFTQWHHSGLSGSPPLEFVVQPPKAGAGSGADFQIRVGVVASSTGQRHYVGIADLSRGQWHHFDIEVRWDPKDGWLKVRHNGQQTMFGSPRVSVVTGARE